MSRMVYDALTILDDGFIMDFGELLHEGWHLKKSLSPLVSTSKIDECYEIAISSGATGGKLLGAGGGGFLLLFVQPELQEDVRLSLSNLVQVPFHFESSGSKIVLYQPNGLS